VASDPAKQDLIRNAAIRVFARKGFHATRAEEIAEEAGIAVGTIYNYFESKSQILLSIFEREFDEEVGLYESLARSGMPVPERFREILRAHFARLASSRDLAKVLVRERYNGSGEIGEALAKMHHKMLERISKLIQDGVDEGWLRACDVRIVAPALFAVVQSISEVAMIYPESQQKTLLATASEELVSLIWAGIAHDGKRGAWT
jgi:TetR/AcrR family transcriptional regulator, fatty acid metabolism regulator protein